MLDNAYFVSSYSTGDSITASLQAVRDKVYLLVGNSNICFRDLSSARCVLDNAYFVSLHNPGDSVTSGLQFVYKSSPTSW